MNRVMLEILFIWMKCRASDDRQRSTGRLCCYPHRNHIDPKTICLWPTICHQVRSYISRHCTSASFSLVPGLVLPCQLPRYPDEVKLWLPKLNEDEESLSKSVGMIPSHVRHQIEGKRRKQLIILTYTTISGLIPWIRDWILVGYSKRR